MQVRSLSKGLQEIAEKELNEVSGRLQEDLVHIKDWISKQPHLKARTDDQWLLSFLRGCKFRMQLTKEKLDFFYTMRTLLPEFFSNRDPFLPKIQEFLKRGVVLYVPTPAAQLGPTLIIVRAAVFDSVKIPLSDTMKAMLMITDILLMENDNYVINGYNVLIDLQDIPHKYLAQLTPNMLKKMSICTKSAYPGRVKSYHIINTPSFFEVIYNLLTKFLPEKITNRITMYEEANQEAINKLIPLSLLPKEYGGKGESIEKLTEEIKLKVESYRDWFLEDAAYCSDETKRIGKPKNIDNMFGEEGSFRKLNLD